MEENRTVERKDADGEWVIVEMSEIKAGDTFRVFEFETEELIGDEEMVALSDAYPMDNISGVATWGVSVALDET